MNAQSSTRTRRALLGVASTAIGLLVIGYLLGQVPPKPRNLGGELHGFVSTSITTNRDAPQWIRLPNIQVRARNTATKALSAPIATNVHGHFNTPRLATGTYQLCVQGAGYVSNCNAQIFKVESENIVLNFDVPITPQAGAVHGRVLLQDGPTRPCFAERQAFDTLVTGKVWLENSAGKTIAGPVTANSAAQYVIPKIPGAASYQIKASCESGQGARSVALTKADLTNTTSFDLTIANHVPVLASLKPTIGGVLARRTDPGATVQVTADATDPDGDTLHYKWISDTPGFTTVDAPSVTWNLPKISAVNVISVQITDGKGGYVFRSISLQSGPNLIEFNGVVRDRASGAVIAGAEVTLIGGGVTRQATTSAQGYFSLAVPDNGRYVMNVNRAGYALVSRIFFASATGLDVLLDAAQVSTLDVDRGGTLIYERKNTVSVRIAPGTLVDAGGKRATGSIRGYAFAYDLDQSDPIPGDLSAKSLGGQDVRLESYGSIHVVFTDMSGNKLQLSPGATADVSFSLQPAAVAAAPHAIPLLSYNEATGFWIEEGQLQLNGGRYEGQVHHFSAFNADTVFTNTSCIQFNVADNDAPSFPFVLHIDYTASGGPRHNNYQVTQSNNVLERLPPNTVVTVTLYPGSGPGTVTSANPHVLGTFQWNSGPQTASSVYPVVNFNSCNGFDTAPLPGNPANPAVIQLSEPGHDTFITGFGAGNLATSNAYYTQLGVLGGPTLRDNFQHWKATNGFNDNPTILVTGEANAQYFNNGDLQLGRDMHCLRTTPSPGRTHIACYVSNYGNGTDVVQGDPQFGSQHAVDHDIAPAATVAMEYDDQGLAVPPVDAVQFYAYLNTGVAFPFDGAAFENPALDTEGKKFLPQNCMACHGGSYDATHNLVDGASFLAFDLFSFLYDSRATTHKGLEDQQEQVRQLNVLVAATKPNNTNPDDPIVSFINGIYAWGTCNVNTAGCRAQDGPTALHPLDQGPYTPPGFQTNVATIALYQAVPRPYCRTCHLAQGSTFPPDWTQFTQMTNAGNKSDIDNVVCIQTEIGGVPNGSLKFMPHAEVPFKAFWFSNNPAAPAFLGDPVTGLGFNPPSGSTDRCPR